MNLRFLINPVTEEPHIYDHGISEDEVAEVLEDGATESRIGDEGSLVAMGHAASGKFLKVIYRFEPRRGTIFIITAYTPAPRARAAYRRRKSKKR